MLFHSDLDPDVKSTVPLVVLSYSGQREIVALPKTYDETEQLVREVFELDSGHRIRFQTRDFASSGGELSFVNRSGWAGVHPLLSTLFIVSIGERQGPSKRPTAATASESPREGKRRRVEHSPSPVQRRHEPVGITRDGKNPAGSSNKGKQKAVEPESTSQALPEASSATDATLNALSREEEDEDLYASFDEGPTGVDSSDVATSQGVLPSSSPQEKFRPPVAQPLVRNGGGSSFRPGMMTPPSPPAPRTQTPEEEPPSVQVKQEQLEVLTKSESEAQLADNGVDGEESQEQPPPSQVGSSSKKPKFQITIEHPPTGSASIFKTSGNSLVSKVLKAACKSFELDFDKAKLLMIVMEEHEMVCQNDDTMAATGAAEGSTFIVKVEDDQEPEDLQEEESFID
ncbi:hypothetical protein JAAARDRAFT_59224 [Jaapia argillacea MUCL 33604]|uniref:Uncharacterized protein n=1 Tax=Jaapia argillacea MUCL 33604 TaxID=933084 RepID=A0A067PNF4_9AGAM|nr:hypothetical protein JAAARDRAFT_59224 [Jaapia argillacea MUCL 33604]